jgi:hypothetical protein
VKQILVTMNESREDKFIIEDLDESHLMIKADEEARVRGELETEVRVLPPLLAVCYSGMTPGILLQLEKNTYSLEAAS